MKVLSAHILCSVLLLLPSTNAFSSDLLKRALKFDPSCTTKYGTLTAKQLLDKSIDMQPSIAKAGKDGLDTVIAMLEYQSKAPGVKKPSVSKDELNKIIATYRVLFGDIKTKNSNGTTNLNFEKEVKEHLTAIKVTRDSLARMTRTEKPDLIIHCNDDWLSERQPKGAKPMPTDPLKTGVKYIYDMDRKIWIRLKGGKPCQGDKAIAVKVNEVVDGARETGLGRITICKGYLKRQQQLEKDKQPHLWDISKSTLPSTFTTYTQAGKKDQVLPFHISAFDKTIGAKWFHEFMHTQFFHTTRKEFADQKVPDANGGTGVKASGFNGAVGLAKQNGGKNIRVSSRNIDTILYWSLAMYYNKWLWSTGKPEDPSSLTAAPVKARNIDERFQVKVAAKKPPKKTVKPADPPKTEVPPRQPPPPQSETPVEPPKTKKPVDPPNTSAAPPPPLTSLRAPPPPGSTQAGPSASSLTPLPSSSTAPSVPASQTYPLFGTQMPRFKSVSTLSASIPISVPSTLSGSVSASVSLPNSCSKTLCTLASSSATPAYSAAIPEETFESEPMNAGSMTGSEILQMAESIASEQIVAMGLWDQFFAGMGLSAESPDEVIEGDPTVSAGMGLPMETGGAGAVANGTWTTPVLRVRSWGEGEGDV
ncbi:uncharacterized protein M421DRAFT_2043 [Didymella exigua CBS 183.55]|uniref:Lysine-specific metallo-endopeptidase domain-containing protein n=1 Tax=Didymella exigua CBS 183.55 TaxID=1150837 RepID=A0A6A5RVB8_9PLEO|nr:uncharacterized protein M421DRAFT_2043 [Didymella exigua CBS 183.55]KAF1932415.1 hypothetical protein M421DRAFT_2043 [Didymella exigua CBS 183.55]